MSTAALAPAVDRPQGATFTAQSTPGGGAAATPKAEPLDLHKGIGSRGCPRWPENLRLESSLGALVPGRCRATNLCDYCAKLAAVENSEVLAQDAMTNTPPALWSVLTTRSTVAEMSAYKTARRAVLRAVRRNWDEAENACLIEFQSGHGTNSGGKRRPHWNDAWKGIPASDAEQLHACMSEAWCSRVDALPKGQHVGAVAEFGGLMRYLALHFQKESQQPPTGWRSHRFTTSRGYLSEPMEDAREKARAALRFRRELWKLEQELGEYLDAEQLDAIARARFGEKHELSWSLVRLTEVPMTYKPDGTPATFETLVLPVG